MNADLARRAGEAIAAVPQATVVDAIVMASAALRYELYREIERLPRGLPRASHLHRAGPVGGPRRAEERRVIRS
jgi:hypothetical protein